MVKKVRQMPEPVMLTNPWFVVFDDDNGKTVCHMHQIGEHGYKKHAAVLAQVVKHIALAYSIPTEQVTAAMLDELKNPQNDIGGKLFGDGSVKQS